MSIVLGTRLLPLANFVPQFPHHLDAQDETLIAAVRTKRGSLWKVGVAVSSEAVHSAQRHRQLLPTESSKTGSETW